MENKYIDRVKELTLKFLGREPVKIILFGSRARGDYEKGSDVDVGILPKGKWNERKLIYLQEALEESHIPYIVEIIDLSTVFSSFRKKVLKEGIIWKE